MDISYASATQLLVPENYSHRVKKHIYLVTVSILYLWSFKN